MKAKKRVLFRVDGGKGIGMGHIIRSLSLAHMLKNDFYCVFATRFLDKYILSEIHKTNCSYIKLPTCDKHFEVFLNLIEKEDIIVLDNYFFDSEYQKQIKKIGAKLVCIDDMHDKHYYSDVIINQGIGLSKRHFSTETYTKLYLGFDYALLRPEFIDVQKTKRNSYKNAFVCIGGIDENNITTKITNLLLKIDTVRHIDVIVGNLFSNKIELNNLIIGAKKTVNLYSSLSAQQMKERMQSADFGIIPASSICIEALAVGMPFLLGYYIDNQKELYNNITTLVPEIALGNFLEIEMIKLPYSIKFDFSIIKTNNIKKNFIRIFHDL